MHCVIFLYLCAALFLHSSVSLRVTHPPLCLILCSWWHACQSVCVRASQASPPAAPGSLNQAGLAWLGLIGGQNRQHEGSLSGGATGGNVETEKNRKHTGTGQQCRSVWSDLRTALISASRRHNHTEGKWKPYLTCGEYTISQFALCEVKAEYLRQMGDGKQWAALDWLFYALTLKMNEHALLYFPEITPRRA